MESENNDLNHRKGRETEFHIVAYLLKAKTVKPEKQHLLTNGSETTFVYRQRPRNNGKTSVARQHILDKRQLNKQQRNGVFCAVCAEML
jgi:hypothetical protein